MMYQACRRPGTKPRTQRRILMRESAEQMPRLTQTGKTVSHRKQKGCHGWEWCLPGRGGKRMAMTPRKMSAEQHMIAIELSLR